MKQLILTTFFLLGFFTSSAVINFGQSTSDVKTATGFTALPFVSGEKLTFEANSKISKVLPISLAEMTFVVNDPGDSSGIIVSAEARSKGSLIRLFRFSFLQKVDSTIDQNNLFALKTVKHDQQKERIRTSESTFDYEQSRVTYVELDPNDTAKPPRTIASEINGETHDILSSIYKLRSLPLSVGRSFELDISDSGLVYKIPVKVTKRERQRTSIGNVWCFRLEAEVFGDGRLIEQSGSLTVWITDDMRRLPVRGLIKTKIAGLSADVDVRLKSSENLIPLKK